MDTAGGRPVTTLIMPWQCAAQTERHAHSHMYSWNFKMESFPCFTVAVTAECPCLSHHVILQYSVSNHVRFTHGEWKYLNFKKGQYSHIGSTRWGRKMEGDCVKNKERRRGEKDAALIPSLLTPSTHGLAASSSSSLFSAPPSPFPDTILLYYWFQQDSQLLNTSSSSIPQRHLNRLIEWGVG